MDSSYLSLNRAERAFVTGVSFLTGNKTHIYGSDQRHFNLAAGTESKLTRDKLEND